MTETGDQSNEFVEYAAVCPECKTGVTRLKYITYFTWLENELITVPNFPAWICDVCGRREYDTRAINWLNTLLNPAAGKKRSPRRRGSAPQIDQPIP
ncbi:MAG: YgiT-type zinc finger protein [Chloroflexi bacterium]|nr:MAG: YgiT-type zinc finger protein [Chloroflexota bacterium]